MASERKFGFTLDRERLAEICVGAYEAVPEKIGLFRQGLRQFLPQWNLPKELEKEPQ